MPAIGIGLLWLAYTGGLWGYCMIRGYNVTAKQLLSSSWPPKSVTGKQVAQDAVQGAAITQATGVGMAGGSFLNGTGQ